MKLTSFVIILFMINACEPGPQGPPGFPGEDAVNNAFSAVYDVPSTAWLGNTEGYTTELNIPEIIEWDYLNSAVLVYRLIEVEPKSFNMLPYTYVDNNITTIMDFNVFVGSIELVYKEIVDGVNDTFAPGELMSFKIIIIEGVPLADLKQAVDIADYNAVNSMFDIYEIDPDDTFMK